MQESDETGFGVRTPWVMPASSSKAYLSVAAQCQVPLSSVLILLPNELFCDVLECETTSILGEKSQNSVTKNVM